MPPSNAHTDVHTCGMRAPKAKTLMRKASKSHVLTGPYGGYNIFEEGSKSVN